MKSFINKSDTLIFLVAIILLTTHTWFLGDHILGGKIYTHYNNYIIFKQSFFHLIQGKDLYILYPHEHWDFFKYSPTFALSMAAFAVLPDFFGLQLWNLLNAFLLFWAIYQLNWSISKKRLAIIFIFFELVTALQNTQSNALVVGLILSGFVFLERKKLLLATLLISLSVYIKLFGLAAFVIFLFYPQKPKFIVYSLMWMILLALIPLLVVSPLYLLDQYQDWVRLLLKDHGTIEGLSVMAWLKSWWGISAPKNWIVLIGMIILLLPLLYFKNYTNYSFRLHYVSSILIWVVIFNHMAESPSYIIAVSGVALWGFSLYKLQKFDLLLMVLVLIFTSLSSTDLFLNSWRLEWVNPYVLKAVPCIMVWLWMQYGFFKKEYPV